MAQFWYIKDKSGQVFGPHTTENISELIKTGVLNGSEKVSPKSDSEWVSVSSIPKFYDDVLTALEEGVLSVDEEERYAKLMKTGLEEDLTKTRQLEDQSKIKTVKLGERTLANRPDDTLVISKKSKVPSDSEGTADRQNSGLNADKSSRGEKTVGSKKTSKDQAMDQEASVTYAPKSESRALRVTTPKKSETIDLPKRELLPELKEKKKSLVPLIILVLLVGFVFLLLEEDKTERVEGSTTLIAPKQFAKSINQTDFDQRFGRALQLFQRDTFKNLQRAQNELVDLAEGASDQPKALALLCLNHLRLWPYSEKTSEDKAALSSVNQRLSQLDPIGANSDTCRVVNHIISDQPLPAKSITDKALVGSPGEPFFYVVKSEFLERDKDYLSSVAYLQKAQQLWPTWLALKIIEARVREKMGQYGEAGKVLRELLTSYPTHSEGLVNLGIMELRYFGNYEKGVEMILEGISADKIAPDLEGRAYVYLSELYSKGNNPSRALEYAKLAYKADPGNQKSRELIVQLGGEGELKSMYTSDSKVIAIGDQFYQSGNLLAAQAEYKTAFEMNPKNGKAAVKAAKTLWELNQSKEAIDWMKKAISAEPDLIEAYILLSDYLSQRYDFDAAAGVLARAQKLSPNNYEVARGFAGLELRRNNFSLAVTHARKALKIYDTDVESHIILSQALYNLGQFNEAFQMTARSIELDGQNVRAQSLYGKVLSAYQGSKTGVDYLKKLITTYPQVIEYRIALAEIFLVEQKYEQARQVLEQIVTSNPKNKLAAMLLAESYRRLNKPNEAIKSFLTAASSDPTDADPLFQIGLVYLESRKANEAQDQFRRVLSINNRYPRANYFLGQALHNMGDDKEALKFAESEKKINPRLAEPYLLAGEIHMKQNRYELAIGEFQKAVNLNVDGAGIYILLARAYRLSGSLDVAEKMISIAVRKESGHPEIYKEQGAIYEKKGQNNEAATSYRRYINLVPNAEDRSIIESRINSLGGG